jgi:SAM-dependent methyltransferase
MLRELEHFIDTHEPCRVLEAGGIDRPLLKKSSAFNYTGLDIEYREKCRQIYDDFIVQSIETPLPGSYNLICSFTLLEHVRNNRRAFNTMYDALVQGGMMVHYVPGGWHPYALVIRLLGPRLSIKILSRLHPEVIGQSGYPAYFDHCTVGKMEQLCRETGFKNITFSCYYRANFYFEVFFPAFLFVTLWEDFCRLLGLKTFCSGFIVTARKGSVQDIPAYKPLCVKSH